MRKQLIENAAFEVAQQVRTVEETIDSALAEIAELQSRMIRARSATNSGVATGHAALEQLATAVQSLVTARGGMVRCHAELVAAKKTVPGLRTVGFGDVGDCPPPEGVADLRIVA